MLAQQDNAQAITTDTAAEVTMAEVEQAWQRGDFVFVRRELERLAREGGTRYDGTALAEAVLSFI